MKKLIQYFTTRMITELFLPLLIACAFFNNSYAQNNAIVNLDSANQMIRGFGAANILPWRPDMTADEINTAFGTGDGQIGFSLLRLRVPYQQSEFALNVPAAQLAYSLGVKIIASPWTPPPAMKTNNNIVGGELRESSYDDFADHLKSFADYMSNNGAPLYGISVQNEPDVTVTYESCDWNASQMVKFIKENAPSVGTKVMAPESFQFRKQFSDPILNDAAACANLDMVAGHIYGGGLEPYPLAESKGKELWMTEHLDLSTDWPGALATAVEINECMYVGMNAYIWWYIVRFYGPIYDDDDRAPAGAVKGEVSKRGYVMSQFSRFIRPGYYRIECNPYSQRGTYITAYKDSASTKVVIVAINTSSQAKSQTFTLQNGSVDAFTPYVTSEAKNCSREEDILVSNGSFCTSLEGSSITTFVADVNTFALENSPSIPESFKLFQNFPNPFNPITTINYSVGERSRITLKVYSLLGEEVMTLFEGVRQPGNYTAIFNGKGLSSGIYLYQLKAENFEARKKLMLLK